MVNSIVAGKTVVGQPSLFTGMFFFLHYVDGKAGNGLGRSLHHCSPGPVQTEACNNSNNQHPVLSDQTLWKITSNMNSHQSRKVD